MKTQLALRFRSRCRALIRPLSASLLLSVLLAGCVLYPNGKGQKSGSVVAFLFPKEKPAVQTPTLPVLQLPLRVGIAFVPDAHDRANTRFSELQKQALASRAAEQFRAQPYVQEIEVVPGAYLRPGGGFENLDQLRTVLGIDVIVLLSYDQVQFTEQSIYSLAYWTIVGAYIFQGNRNDTHTLMEATVYDIASRSLLFRAPGVNQTKASTGLAYLEAALRKDSADSFDKATADLTLNLDGALARFRTAIKEGRTTVQIVHKPGYSGGGAIDERTAGILLVTFLICAALYARKHLGGCSRKEKEGDPR